MHASHEVLTLHSPYLTLAHLLVTVCRIHGEYGETEVGLIRNSGEDDKEDAGHFEN